MSDYSFMDTIAGVTYVRESPYHAPRPASPVEISLRAKLAAAEAAYAKKDEALRQWLSAPWTSPTGRGVEPPCLPREVWHHRMDLSRAALSPQAAPACGHPRESRRMKGTVCLDCCNDAEEAEAIEAVIDAAQYVGTQHSGWCATVACNCVGHAKRLVVLDNALARLKAIREGKS